MDETSHCQSRRWDAPRLEEIVCATDFSPASGEAFGLAVALAGKAGAHVSVVHLAEHRRQRPAAESRLREFVASHARDVPLDGAVLVGEPAREIASFARRRRADLILLGDEGSSGGLVPLTLTDVVRFFRVMIDFRKRHPCLRHEWYFEGKLNERGVPDLSWHGTRLNSPAWNNPASGVLAFTLGAANLGEDVHVILNMEEQPLEFELRRLAGRTWLRVADTARSFPEDILEPGGEVPVAQWSYRAEGRSSVVLVSGPATK